MIGPIKYLSRILALRKWKSANPRAILPLSKVRSAVVLVDSAADDASSVSRSVKQFFDYKSIPVEVLCPTKEQLNYAGYLRKKFRLFNGTRQEDLYISLVTDPENFASRFEALCSPASFKVGCCQFKGESFDLLVSAPEGVEASQSARFSAIKEYLNKII